MICPSCSNSNDADATFCAFCGGSLQIEAANVSGPLTGGLKYASVAPALPATSVYPVTSVAEPLDEEPLDFDRFIDVLCRDQGFLAQMAIRFYYVSGLKSYLVTSHDSFVVPNLRCESMDIYKRIKREMDDLGYRELFTTYLYLRKEHIQTLPYLSRTMMVDVAGVQHNLNFFGSLIGALRLLLEVFFGIFFLIADLVKLIVRNVSAGVGLSVRSGGQSGPDELLTGKRLMLASSYRHTRTYTYVRDVGPETYVGWFTHHEPLPGTSAFLIIAVVFILFGWLTGVSMDLPIVFFFGIVLGLAYIFLFAPWLLHKLRTLPQPRYLSAMVFALFVPMMFVGYNIMDNFSTRFMMGGGYGMRRYGADPFSIMLSIATVTANYALFWIAIVVLIRAITLSVSHYDQFDAEAHSKIIKERIGLILAELLETSGYTPAEIGDILQQSMPGAGRYRRARS
jgi:hypothetical protein